MLSTNRQRIAVALSGGVDSSVVALLLQRQGFDVVGVHMQNWDPLAETSTSQRLSRCSAERDRDDARAVCQQLAIRLHTVSFEREYWTDVFQPSLAEYETGLVPNPDLLCNRHVKFDLLVDHCQSKLDCDWIATGHYARLLPVPDPLLPGAFPFRAALTATTTDIDTEHVLASPAHGRRGLFRAVDPVKDQSYFLAAVAGSRLQRVLFPLGGMCKTDVRRIAADAQLATAQKRDSTGICFVGEKKHFRRFLADYIHTQPGRYRPLDASPNEARLMSAARHDGASLYTVGQRARIPSMEQAWYVYDKDMAANELLVCKGDAHPKLLSSALVAKKVHWIHDAPEHLLLGEIDRVRLRSTGPFLPIRAAEQAADSSLRVVFNAPVAGVTPGQYAVFYSGDFVLGCGKIDDRLCSAA